MNMLAKLDNMKRAKVTLRDGTVATGTSWGILDAEDDYGNDLGFEVLIFMTDTGMGALTLEESDIKEAVLA